MVVSVTLNYEFYEVLNAFPVLSNFFEKDLRLNLNNVIEGDSVDDFFNKCDLNNFEKNIILRQVNQKLKTFFGSESRLDALGSEDLVEEEYVDEIISADEEE